MSSAVFGSLHNFYSAFNFQVDDSKGVSEAAPKPASVGVIKIHAWNYKGLGSEADNPIVSFLVNMVHLYYPDVFCLFKTKANVKKVSTRLQVLGYPYTAGVDPERFFRRHMARLEIPC